jgi:cytochrome P450
MASALYRPPAPVPTTPVRALMRGLLSNQRDTLSLMPSFAYETMAASVGWTRRGVFLLNDPALVGAMLGERSAEFPKNDLMVNSLAPLVGEGVFISDGATWRRQRRMIEPAFSAMRVNAAFDAMVASIDDFESVLDADAESGRDVSLEAAMSHLTADIICRTIFSQPLESDAARAIYDAFSTFQNTIATVQVARLWLGRAGAPVRQPKSVTDAAAAIRHHVGRMIDARTAEGVDRHTDIAGAVIGARDPHDESAFTREELIDQIGTFFMAGHETTAGALAWTFFILSQQPDALERMRAEIDAACPDGAVGLQAVKGLSYTRAVFRETLRLYPPLPFVPRVARAAATIGPLRVPQGAMILISPWLIHRHRKLWRDADRFDPDRFLGGGDHAPGAYLPFGLGPRVCVGAAFAMMEAVLILARIAARYDIEATDPASVRPAARLTTRTASDIRVRIRRRLRAADPVRLQTA